MHAGRSLNFQVADRENGNARGAVDLAHEADRVAGGGLRHAVERHAVGAQGLGEDAGGEAGGRGRAALDADAVHNG